VHRDARVLLADLAQVLDDLRLALEALPVPPRPVLEVELALGRQVDFVRMVQPAPRLGCVERMVRIGE
jgi:hypothetical protein